MFYQVRHKDEYIAELEARLEREVTEVAQVVQSNWWMINYFMSGFQFINRGEQ